MRIGLFTDTYLPNINGVVTSVEILRKKLEEMGHDVYVVCTYSGLFRVQREGNIIRLPGVEVKKLYGYSLAQPFHVFYLDDIRDLHLDLIHCHTEFGVGIFATMCAKSLQIPLVRTYHTTYEDYTHYVNLVDSETLDAGLKKAVSYLSKVYGNDCVRLISPSKKTKELLESYKVKTPIDVIPTGVELDRFRNRHADDSLYEKVREEYARRPGEKIFLYVGRIAEEKSIDMLIKAFAMVKEEEKNARLLIIGGGPAKEDLEEYTRKQGLQDYVQFLGTRPNTSIPVYYQSADCFLSASTSETQGMTYIEALASGILVMGRVDEALTGLIHEGENGYYFNDEKELYEKICLFLSLSEERQSEMKKNAVSSVDIYDADLFAQKVLTVYEKAIKEYASYFVIKNIRLKDDYVNIVLEAGNGEEEKLSVSLDSYYREGLRASEKLSNAIYETLKEEEGQTLAYAKCLKKLSNRDHTVAEMRRYMDSHFDLTDEEAGHVIARLTALGLLDDRNYAYQRFDSMNKAMMSRKRIAAKLKKAGVSGDIIEECLKENDTDESYKARHQARKYQGALKGKSLRMKQQAILKRLVNDGFSYDTAKEAIASLDFSDETFEEKDLLKKEAQKAYKRLSKKHSGTELRNRMYYSLLAKGFTYEKIYAVISEMEEEL